MKVIFRTILIFGFSLNLILPAMAVEFFDINKPGIEKAKIYVIANNSTDIIDPLVEQLKNQLGKTLLFTVLDDPQKASYKLDINATSSSDTISATLSGSQVESITVGMKFRSEKPDYISRKSAQLGNLLIKKLMGINGSLGSIMVWSESKRGESRNSLFMGRLGIDKKTKLTYNLYNNTGASWDPKGDDIIYSAQTGRGSEVLWQGFRPLRLKSKSIHFDQGKGSSASWGSNGKIYLAKYRGDKNTDIYEYHVVRGGKGKKPSLEMSRRLTKHSAIETEPVLSPDGKKLAYISDRTGRPQVYMMDLSSKKVSRISKKGSYNTSPAWSPDSTMVAFTSSRKGSRTAIYRVRVGDTLRERQVSPKGMAAESPTWSPDGSMVAFQGWHRGDWKIIYVLSSGSSAERLTNSKQGIVETGPTWSSRLR